MISKISLILLFLLTNSLLAFLKIFVLSNISISLLETNAKSELNNIKSEYFFLIV